MKRELKIGDSQIITINENGSVSVSDDIQMRVFEIAELFGVFAQTIRSNIRAILKSGMYEARVVGRNSDYFFCIQCVGGMLLYYHDFVFIYFSIFT